jgi:transposase
MHSKSANSMHYVGLDVHKKSVSFCVKLADGTILQEGTIKATRPALTTWAKTVGQPWTGALEATIFTGWIYDYLRLEAHELKVAHPAMLKAIFAGKKSNDKIDARKISDLLRCNLLPESYMAPSWIRDLRRILRYRRMLLTQSVRFKNRISGLLMETGTEHEKTKLHGKKYFSELVQNLQEAPDSVRKLLQLSRSIWENFHRTERQLIAALQKDARLRERIRLLMTIPSIGEITALTWALETGEPDRFRSISRAVSYCGLCSAQRESAGIGYRGPLSKQRNKHLQSVLVETAKLAPRYSPPLAALYARELERGNHNRATLAVARKLVAYLLSVDRSGKDFQIHESPAEEETKRVQGP